MYKTLTEAFYWISKLCDIPTVAVVGTLLVIYFVINKKFHFATGTLISIVGSGVSVFQGKTYLK